MSNASSITSSPAAIILAAGKGTRMKSDLPKVAFPVGDRPMVCAVVDACIDAGCSKIIPVVGYKQEIIREALAGYANNPAVALEFAVQDEQLGTGHAVQCSASAFAARQGNTFVLAGDGPLVRASTLHTMLERHRATNAAATIATSIIDDPTGYGRIVRDSNRRFKAIVEHKNCTPEQRLIREINPSYYLFNVYALFTTLPKVPRNPVGNEYYLTDVLETLLTDGHKVEVVDAVPPEDVLSINTPEELARVDALFRQRPSRRSSVGASSGGA
jgi:bifunctional UDP-N-acetylglucosamine pyrophosphorylase / glucosamine-1-phosphate N-acetyltransferase